MFNLPNKHSSDEFLKNFKKKATSVNQLKPFPKHFMGRPS